MLYKLVGNVFMPEVLITIDGYNVDLSQIARDNGWSGSGDFKMRVIVMPGVVIGSASTGAFALHTGDLPATSELTLINNGTIAGCGGSGGGALVNGAVGGPGLSVGCLLEFDNTNGIVGGGGGGGGGGGHSNTRSNGGGGGGGAGRNGGEGAWSPQNANKAQNGTLFVGGAGGFPDSGTTKRNDGGAGGDLGLPGAIGLWLDTAGVSPNQPPGAGGAAGTAIDGVSKITFINRGDIRGAEIN
ncbi:hypothetical protein [Kiloniella laminariae]|uniref:hypothetical protein n=1 Tax=Kiloniella laminariae TaxID=454162 RepID=UPI000362730B|nr:hypothetical protein [Kiloniella laminariae]